MKVTNKDFNLIMDSVKNPKYNEKLARALKRDLQFNQPPQPPPEAYKLI